MARSAVRAAWSPEIVSVPNHLLPAGQRDASRLGGGEGRLRDGAGGALACGGPSGAECSAARAATPP